MKVLVTGATGYIGGRLVPRLIAAGHEVRVLVRDAGRVAGRPWAKQVMVVEGDLLGDGDLAGALAGADAAFYLVHAMAAGRDFAARDRAAASRFAAAAAEAGVGHVVYLGGLMPEGDAASAHLASRAETGRVLEDGLPGKVTELRAGPIIGSGSASFEMVRYLTERLPAMIAPRWVVNRVQPIAIGDVLGYLLATLAAGPAGVVDVGADVLTFRQMMQVYARCRGLRRWIVPVPVLAPWLAARWVGLVTPISNRLAVPLVEGMVRPLVADTRRARELFPEIAPIDYEQAVRLAIDRTEAGAVETRWSGALGAPVSPTGQPDLADWEGVITERRRVPVAAPADRLFEAFTSLGGQTGWLVWGWTWKLRGAMDKLVGGPGLRRGRRHPTELMAGETLDFWRVELVDRERGVMLLRAEMKVPGRAWLRWEAVPVAGEPGRCELEQIAFFEPRGLQGFLYWYALYPLHRLIFTDMARAVGRRGERG